MCILKSIFRVDKKIITLLIGTNIATFFLSPSIINYLENYKNKVESDELAVFVETSDGSGMYTLSSMSSIPTDKKYIYNSELSKCINGGVLSWNENI